MRHRTNGLQPGAGCAVAMAVVLALASGCGVRAHLGSFDVGAGTVDPSIVDAKTGATLIGASVHVDRFAVLDWLGGQVASVFGRSVPELLLGADATAESAPAVAPIVTGD